MESSEVTIDLGEAEKRRPCAEDLCIGEDGGDVAESKREAPFCPPVAG